jgi:ribonuclease P protein component
VTTTQTRRFSLKFFRVIWEDVDQDEGTTVELAPRVNRQLSKATERNRIKRILREFFRGHPEFFKRGRWVFIAKSNAEKKPNHEIFTDLEKILSKVS